MYFRHIPKYLFTLFALISWLYVSASAVMPPLNADQVNLALRRTADKLLRLSGDTVSRIPAIEHVEKNVWRVYMYAPFEYDALPSNLQASMDMYHISQVYEVAIRQCENDIIDLGYHKLDFVQDSIVPCGGRPEPEGCHYIEISFLDQKVEKSFWSGKSYLLMLAFMSGAGVLWWFRRKPSDSITNNQEVEWLEFGKSKLNINGQVLVIGGIQIQLTYRETKLLKLFAIHQGQLLERESILQQVWGDEGIQVGRSVDVFVSRLRKKLASDETLGIVAVHGVGYRMEVNGKQ